MRLAWSLLACTTILVTGCSVSTIANKAPATTPDPTPAVTVSISGIVHGGQQPIDQASIYMLSVKTGSYGQSSNYLLTGTGLTDTNGHSYVKTSNGRFSIAAGQYTCNVGDQVYLYSIGGNASFGTNVHAGLMAVLGACGSGNTFPQVHGTVQMNEVTTVAAAYALAGYATDATDMSGNQTGSTMAAKGLANAAANAAILASLSTGQALAPGDANGAIVQEQINTLANILAACINSNGAVTNSPTETPCYTVLTNSLSAGTTGSQPGDTATAAINIVHNPGVTRPSNFFQLATAQSPFQNNLSNPPNDWTLALTWNALTGATNLAVDASGNVWVTNDSDNKLTERSPTGANLSGTGWTGGGSLNKLTGIAIDDAATPTIWVTNASDTGTITKISSATPNSGTTISGNGLADPYNVAIDISGNIWVANIGNNSVSKFSSSGATIANYTAPVAGGGTQFQEPDGIVIDPTSGFGNVWITNAGCVECGPGSYGTSIVKLNSSGSPFTSSGGYTGGGLQAPISNALDHSGNVWMSNFEGMPSSGFNGSISEFNNSGTAVSGTDGITGGGVSGTFGGPYGIAVDGDGKVWTANLGPTQASNKGSISAYNPATTSFLSPANGFQPGLNKPNGIVIDASGNVWVANNGDGSITELIGAAAPVVVPIVTGVKNNTLGTRP